MMVKIATAATFLLLFSMLFAYGSSRGGESSHAKGIQIEIVDEIEC